VVVGVARVVVHIPASRSLKDKRQVVKSVLARVQREFQIAAAEVEQQDRWQLAVLGLASVSTDSRHCDEVLARAVSFIAGHLPEGHVVDVQTEILHAL
jgi:uncharacterized protein YlxP (DUF503 family)